MKVLYHIFGGCRLSAVRSDTERILNVCMHYGFIYKNLCFVRDCVVFDCSMYTAELLRSVCAERGIRLSLVKSYGLPDVIRRYRKRVGIPIGIALAVALIIISGQFVWDVRVSGCETIDESVVISELMAHGFGMGTYIPGADIDATENSVLIDSPDIAWLAINQKGTVAHVEIREKVSAPGKESDRAANLVAAWDGQIEAIEAARGNILVKPGQHVRRGELLVSGIYDSNVWGYRYTRAAGAVWARTVREIHIEIPIQYPEKCYSGEKYTEKTLFFFSKEIKLYRNTGFLGGTYDTISNMEYVCLFDGTRLPALYKTTTYSWYTYEMKTRSQNEAIDLAYEELDAKISQLTSAGGSLLRKNISGTLTETSYVLDCTLTLIENIAETSEFDVLE